MRLRPERGGVLKKKKKKSCWRLSFPWIPYLGPRVENFHGDSEERGKGDDMSWVSLQNYDGNTEATT